AMREQFVAAKIARPEQYVTVYSGMEIDSFINPAWSRHEVRQELGLNESDFVFGTVARLAELKGHDDLLDALSSTLREKPHVKLLWVGDGWLRESLMQRVRELGLTNQVITTGLVPPEMIPRYLQAMDVLIHPSYREGLPRTVTQALLSATPVIAYDVDGTREVCIEGETGRLLRAGDLAGLREAAQWMLEHPKEREAMGMRGREICRERFAASRMVEHLDQIYRAQLNRR
ncbi:MAG TPA: glycosyltransferase, partial [Phycisphaerales bacterium]|nr:glycosyltransferase [Phycisphaerales bacterium]